MRYPASLQTLSIRLVLTRLLLAGSALETQKLAVAPLRKKSKLPVDRLNSHDKVTVQYVACCRDALGAFVGC